MPINGLVFLQAGTATFAGGTSKTLTSDGMTVPNGIHVVDTSVTDFRTRPNATFKYKPPTIKADKTYTKQKNSYSFVVPFIDAAGTTQFNLVRGEIEYHPETTAAALQILRSAGAQLFMDTDTDNFYVSGATA